MPMLIGIENFERKLKDLSLTVKSKALTKATKRGGELIRSEAANRAPRNTGRLAANEIISLRTSESSPDYVTIRIGPAMTVFHGLFEEIGTAHSIAEPFLGPAFEATKEGALRIASSEFVAAIDQVIRKGA